MKPAPVRMLPLEHRLPLMLATVLLATMGVALFVTHHTLMRGAEESAEGRLMSATEVIVDSLESSARRREAELREAAAAPAMRRLLDSARTPAAADLRRARRVIVPILARWPRDATIELLDPRGRLVAQWGAMLPDAVRPAVSGAPRAPEGVDGAAGWTPPAILMNGQLFTGTAVHVRDDRGRLLGTLVAVRRGNTQPGASRAIRGLTGAAVTLYVGNAGDDRRISLPAGTDPPVVPARDGDTTLRRARVREAVGGTLTVEHRVNGTPWVAMLALPGEAVRAAPLRTMQQLAGGFFLLAVVAAAITWRISRGVTHPIQELTAAASEIAHGRTTAAVELDRTDELGQLAISFNTMAQQIAVSRSELEHRISEVERANRAKSDFLAMMSHELRTPLNAISGYTQLLEMGINGPLTGEQRNALARIAHSQRHLLRLIEDVLNFARLDAGRVDFNLAEFDVASAIAGVRSMVEPQARAKRIDLVSRIPDGPLTVYADREKLDQILLNLLTNAIKFTPEAGMVEIGAEALPRGDEHGHEEVRISVSDTGPGVAPAHRDTIFEPFVQGDRGLNRPSEGVGLGLAISRDLSIGMGGRLVLDTPRLRGATFTVTLPRHAPAPEPDGSFPHGEAPRTRIVPV